MVLERVWRKEGGCEGKSISHARFQQRKVDEKWNKGQANKVHFQQDDTADEEGGEVDEAYFQSALNKVMSARLQGEVGCAGLKIFMGSAYEDDSEVQVNRAAAFTSSEGHKQIDNGLSYFRLLSDQKWFPLGGASKHKVTLEVAKESVKPVKAAMLGPVYMKIGPDNHGEYTYVGGDQHIGICDSRFAELACYNRFERNVSNVKTGHKFVTADDELHSAFEQRK
jgi:hypothetical protein